MTLVFLALSLALAAEPQHQASPVSLGGAGMVRPTFQLVPERRPSAPVVALKAVLPAPPWGEIVHETVTVCHPNVRKADPSIDPKMSREGPKDLDPRMVRRTVCPPS